VDQTVQFLPELLGSPVCRVPLGVLSDPADLSRPAHLSVPSFPVSPLVPADPPGT